MLSLLPGALILIVGFAAGHLAATRGRGRLLRRVRLPRTTIDVYGPDDRTAHREIVAAHERKQADAARRRDIAAWERAGEG